MMFTQGYNRFGVGAVAAIWSKLVNWLILVDPDHVLTLGELV